MKEYQHKEKNYWKPLLKIMFWIFIAFFLVILLTGTPLHQNLLMSFLITISLMFIITPIYFIYVYFKKKKITEKELKIGKFKANYGDLIVPGIIIVILLIGFIGFFSSTPTPQKSTQLRKDLQLKNEIDYIEDVSDVNVGYENDNSAIIVSLSALYDPSFTESMIVLGNDREGMLYKSSQIFKKVFPMDNSISIVRVYVYKYEKDAYGNKIKKDLGSVELSRQEYNKINWEGFSSHNLPKIAKVNYEIHNEREAQIEAMRQYMENS